MAVANFFSRATLAAAHVLHGYDPDRFRQRIDQCMVALAFDRCAAESREGAATLELCLDLLARLYPRLALVGLDPEASTVAMQKRLEGMALAINPVITIKRRLDKAVCCIVVGNTEPLCDARTIYIGSDGWVARFSDCAPVGSGQSENPFAAGAAACFGAANAFRILFSEQLQQGLADAPFELDILHHRRLPSGMRASLPDKVDLGETHLVGLGAIGRAAAWALARVPQLAGTLHLVDHEAIDHSNLQRYVGTTQKSVKAVKVTAAAKMFGQPGLEVRSHHMKWGEYLAKRADYRLARVAVALDTAADRIAVQAGLPRRILNAWTQPGDLGVSRHGFTEGPCLMCLYLPPRTMPSLSELVAAAIHMPEIEVRRRLDSGETTDRDFIERIAAASGVKLADLLPFMNRPLREFYSRAVCGTTFFGTAHAGGRGNMAVPMAFQSALAGILLALEIVADASLVRSLQMLPVSRIDLRRPLGRSIMEPEAKHPSGRCICQDRFYSQAFGRKYAA